MRGIKRLCKYDTIEDNSMESINTTIRKVS